MSNTHTPTHTQIYKSVTTITALVSPSEPTTSVQATSRCALRSVDRHSFAAYADLYVQTFLLSGRFEFLTAVLLKI